MNLSAISDSNILAQIKNFVQNERDLLVKILHHLREIERRRLFSDLGYPSLFAYAMGELKATPSAPAATRVTPPNKSSMTVPTVPLKEETSSNPRYISRAVKHFVWHRDGGRCTNCSGRSFLNYDHVKPVALGGAATVENLRLLCFSCNQRASVKVFGETYRPKTY